MQIDSLAGSVPVVAWGRGASGLVSVQYEPFITMIIDRIERQEVLLPIDQKITISEERRIAKLGKKGKICSKIPRTCKHSKATEPPTGN